MLGVSQVFNSICTINDTLFSLDSVAIISPGESFFPFLFYKFMFLWFAYSRWVKNHVNPILSVFGPGR